MSPLEEKLKSTTPSEGKSIGGEVQVDNDSIGVKVEVNIGGEVQVDDKSIGGEVEVDCAIGGDVRVDNESIGGKVQADDETIGGKVQVDDEFISREVQVNWREVKSLLHQMTKTWLLTWMVRNWTAMREKNLPSSGL